MLYNIEDSLSRTENLSNSNKKNLLKISQDVKHLEDLLLEDEDDDHKFLLGEEDI